MILLIAIGTKERSENNSELIREIKSADGWWNYIPNVWIISTDLGVEEWTAHLKEHNVNDTNFLIIDITNSDRQGWLPSKAWAWFHKKKGTK